MDVIIYGYWLILIFAGQKNIGTSLIYIFFDFATMHITNR